MSELHFVENLLEALDELNVIEDRLNELDNRKTELRNQIQKWLDINNQTHFEVKDNTSQIWKIKISTQMRRSISDWDILTEVLGDTNKHLIVEKDSNTFTVKKAKKFSEEWLTR